MAVFPKWLLGRNLTAISLVPQAIDPATGALTADSSTYTIKGRVDMIRLVNRVEDEVVRSVDSYWVNHVITGDDLELELTEILVDSTASAAGTNVNRAPVLPLLPTLRDVFAITFARGGQVYGPVYMNRGTLTDGISAAGKNTVSMTFTFCDVTTDASGATPVGLHYA